MAGKLFDHVPASIIIIDRKGKIVAVNKNFTYYTDKPASSMVGKNLLHSREIKNPELAQKYRNLLTYGIPFHKQPFRHYAELQNKWYDMSLTAVPILSGHGNIRGAISIAQDVTELVKTQKELRQANSRLNSRLSTYAKELSRKKRELEDSLVFKTQFFANASHELRTPLTIILGSLDVINMKFGKQTLPKPLKNILDSIRDETLHMKELLGDISLLNAADRGSMFGEFKQLNFQALTRKEIAKIKPVAKQRKLRLLTKLSPAFPYGDSTLLAAVIRNLLTNAIRYTPAGGIITVRLSVRKPYACLSVKDTGIGISESDMPHIFERFFRAIKARDRASGGTGLGLSICQEIVEQHGGSIGVQSKLGKGSEFIVKLPLRKN